MIFGPEAADGLAGLPDFAFAEFFELGIEFFAVVGLAVGIDRAL